MLVGFVNVAWDGGDHAFLLDTKTRLGHQHRGSRHQRRRSRHGTGTVGRMRVAPRGLPFRARSVLRRRLRLPIYRSRSGPPAFSVVAHSGQAAANALAISFRRSGAIGCPSFKWPNTSGPRRSWGWSAIRGTTWTCRWANPSASANSITYVFTQPVTVFSAIDDFRRSSPGDLRRDPALVSGGAVRGFLRNAAREPGHRRGRSWDRAGNEGPSRPRRFRPRRRDRPRHRDQAALQALDEPPPGHRRRLRGDRHTRGDCRRRVLRHRLPLDLS